MTWPAVEQSGVVLLWTHANSAYLIDQQGVMRFSQQWVDTYELEREINKLLGKP